MSDTRPCRIDLIVGTRPNIVKVGPLVHALSSASWCRPRVVFLEQHQTSVLGDDTLEDLQVDAGQVLRIPLSTGHYGSRLGEMIAGYAHALRDTPPDLVVVFGDVDATLAAACATKREGLPLAHVEAGLRSHDKRMPEELNRLIVDSIADLFFTTTEDASETLVAREGKPQASVHFVGNLMIDSLFRTLDRDRAHSLCATLGVSPREFALATFHRPSNVDDKASLRQVVDLLRQACARLKVVLPLHPRTAAALRRHDMFEDLASIKGLVSVDPIRYREFISLLSLARVALTDSGGLQEETSVLGIPCITVRENTERPITLSLGTNRLVDPAQLPHALDAVLASQPPGPASIPLWDGRAALRIVDALAAWWERLAPPSREPRGLH